MKHFCKEASQLASDAFERNLSFVEHVRLRLHLLICGMCRNYASNLSLLHRTFSGIRHQTEKKACLSDEGRKHIEKALKQATHPD